MEKLKSFMLNHKFVFILMNVSMILFIVTAVVMSVNTALNVNEQNKILTKVSVDNTEPATVDIFESPSHTDIDKTTFNKNEKKSSELSEDSKKKKAEIKEYQEKKTKSNNITNELTHTVESLCSAKRVSPGISSESAETRVKLLVTDGCFNKSFKELLNDKSYEKDEEFNLTSISFAKLDTESPQAVAEMYRGDETFFYRFVFTKADKGWLIDEVSEYK